jgi:hypothetical protein
MSQTSQITGKRFCDVYALLEAPQEIFFGNIPGVNKMPTETVWVSNSGKDKSAEKVYFSPTKRRGVDRRTLLWTKVVVGNSERQYQEAVNCGLPRTCRVCAVCKLYGGISTERRGTFMVREEGQSDEDFISKIMSELDFPATERLLFEKLLGKIEKKTQVKLEALRTSIDNWIKGKEKGAAQEEIATKEDILKNLRNSIEMRIEEERRPLSITSRIEYGGGVAVQPLPPEWKQRLSTGSTIESLEDVSTPFKKQYGQPSLLFPVYYHMFFVDEDEIGLVAHAFLNSLPRYGAGHPKGFNFHYNKFKEEGNNTEPMIVVDEYFVPQGDRPVVSTLINSMEEAVKDFKRKALNVRDGKPANDGRIESQYFIRYYGERAHVRLKELSEKGLRKLQQNIQQ